MPQFLTETLPSGGPSLSLINGVVFDEFGRQTKMTMPQGTTIHRLHLCESVTTQSPLGGHLKEIRVGIDPNTDNATSYNRLRLSYDYDSFDNIKSYNETITNGSNITNTTNAFTYDDWSRLLSGYGHNFAYDKAGRISDFEYSGSTHNYSPKRYEYQIMGSTLVVRWEREQGQ